MQNAGNVVKKHDGKSILHTLLTLVALMTKDYKMVNQNTKRILGGTNTRQSKIKNAERIENSLDFYW